MFHSDIYINLSTNLHPERANLITREEIYCLEIEQQSDGSIRLPVSVALCKRAPLKSLAGSTDASCLLRTASGNLSLYFAISLPFHLEGKHTSMDPICCLFKVSQKSWKFLCSSYHLTKRFPQEYFVVYPIRLNPHWTPEAHTYSLNTQQSILIFQIHQGCHGNTNNIYISMLFSTF